MNTLMALTLVNLTLILYIVWLQKRVSRMVKENEHNKRALLQKSLKIDALERRQRIEINNQLDATDLDERLRAKGYVSSGL